MRKGLGIGVDLGATRIRVCVGDREGNVTWKASKRMPIPKRVGDYVGEIIEVIGEAVKHVREREDLEGIGVASIGPLDLKAGGLAAPVNLPYRSIPLVGPLKDRFRTRVALMNDAGAAALGESKFGAGKGHGNLVYVTLSTGIGGGAIVDGHLLIGKDGNAAEIGHVVVDSAGRLTCGCGRRGHWEAYCSGTGIPSLAALLARGEGHAKDDTRLQNLLGVDGPVDAAVILKAAAEGNRFGQRVADEMGRLSAIGIANAVNAFDPSLVTIGGGVALGNRKLVLEPLRRLVPLYSVNRAPEIIITPLGDDAGLLGGLTLAFDDWTELP